MTHVFKTNMEKYQLRTRSPPRAILGYLLRMRDFLKFLLNHSGFTMTTITAVSDYKGFIQIVFLFKTKTEVTLKRQNIWEIQQKKVISSLFFVIFSQSPPIVTCKSEASCIGFPVTLTLSICISLANNINWVVNNVNVQSVKLPLFNPV